MAAQRIASTSRPLRVGVSKPSSAGRHRNRNDRGMEIDQVGSSSTSRSAGRNNRNNRQGKNNNNSNNNNNNKNRGGNRKPQRKNDKPKASLNQTDLDKDLDSYMMRNESTARNNLDMELDSYMSAAPSKN
jgi:hypothetical protein